MRKCLIKQNVRNVYGLLDRIVQHGKKRQERDRERGEDMQKCPGP